MTPLYESAISDVIDGCERETPEGLNGGGRHRAPRRFGLTA
jgi:hypothetical protein